jgi:hypothetical protein
MNKLNNIVINLLIFVQLMLLSVLPVSAQQLTQVKGHVIDAATKEPLPFVNIVFE